MGGGFSCPFCIISFLHTCSTHGIQAAALAGVTSMESFQHKFFYDSVYVSALFRLSIIIVPEC